MPLFLGENKISKVVVSVESADGGINTNDATLSSGAQMLSGVTAYSKGTKYTGTIATVTGPTPDIAVSDSGIITASVSNPKGYQSSATTKTATQQLTTQGIKVITPNDSVQTAVSAGVYTTAPTTVSAVPTETKTITANGTYTPSSGKYFSSVNVNVVGDTFDTQEKSVTPTESEQVIGPDAGYDGLSSVTVGAISSTYIGSGITRKSAATITPSESAQTIAANQYLTGIQTISAIPSDYVGSDVTRKSAATITPSTSIQTAVSAGTYVIGDIKVAAMTNGELNAPTVNASGLVTSSVKASGYLDTSKTSTLQLTTKGATTITPSTSVQTAVASGTYTTGDIKVAAIPTGTLGTPSVNTSGLVTASVATSGYLADTTTSTLQLTTKTAETFVPATIDQTIDAGQYLTGAQTIKGDGNLVPENIISGKSIFGVSGSVVIQKYYTGASDPSSSLGNDGDIYLKA